MRIAALVAWVLTAGGGSFMLAIWLRSGGLSDQGSTGPRIRPKVLFTHLGLAATGLAIWTANMVINETALASLAFVLLMPVAGLGFAMLAKWLGGRASAAAHAQPEQRFPPVVVALHGIAAVSTLVLVLLSAIGG